MGPPALARGPAGRAIRPRTMVEARQGLEMAHKGGNGPWSGRSGAGGYLGRGPGA